MKLMTPATASDEGERQARVAVLPIGSFEQHGAHLPLITDTVVACAVAEAVMTAHPDLLLRPPITFSCSQEHVGWAGTVSISSQTLTAVIKDIADSLVQSGVDRLALDRMECRALGVRRCPTGDDPCPGYTKSCDDRMTPVV